MTKQANLGGGGNESGFEQAFSSLAYAYLRDKAPRLLDSMLGFQLVDRNEDNTKAIGVFGFKLDRQLLYAPVFFLNGDLKGHELLYVKDTDSFVPLKESWINYLMSRRPQSLGDSAGVSKLRELGGMYPDIRTLSIPPSIGGGKRASDDAWLRAFLPLCAATKVGSAKCLYPATKSHLPLDYSKIASHPFSAALASVAPRLNLNNVLPCSFSLLKTAYAAAEAFPAIRHGFNVFYGTDCFSRWGKALKKKEAAAQTNLVLPEKRASRAPTLSLIPTETYSAPTDPVKAGKLRLYVSEFTFGPAEDYGSRGRENSDDLQAMLGEASVDNAELDSDSREQLLRDGILIRDGRTDAERSTVYSTQLEAALTNPTETDLYRVLERPGSFEKMLVVMHGCSNRGNEPTATVVRLDGSVKKWLNTYPANIWTDQVAEREEWQTWFKSLPANSQLEEGAEYIGIMPDRTGTVPFFVQSAYDKERYRVDFRTTLDYGERLPASHTPKKPYPFSEEGFNMPSPYGAMLYIGKEGRRGTAIRAISGELRVPATIKFLKLADAQKPQSGELMPCCAYNSRSDMPPIQLGRIEDVHLFFYEKTSALKLHDTGTDIYITSGSNQRRMTKKAALWQLVRAHGLSEKIARELLRTVAQRTQATYRIAYATGYGGEKTAAPNTSVLAGGPSAPIYDDFAEERNLEQYGPSTTAPTQFSSAATYRLNDLAADQQDPGIWNQWQNFEAQDFQQASRFAQEAASSGQKEVFDVTMLSGMLKSVRQDSLVERHLADLVEALDSIGRLLFNFYWHQEEFEDRYGKSDLPELEDGLRNAFESIGDLTLFLKEKTIESSADLGEITLNEVGGN